MPEHAPNGKKPNTLAAEVPEYPQILGVYSMRREDTLGIGGTAAKQEQVTYWYVRRMAPDTFEVQPLNIHHVPSGIRSTVKSIDFLKQYVPEPAYYKHHTVPALATLARKIEKGEEFFAKGELDDAEREFLKALMIDELNVRANFGLGEVYSEQKEYQKLKKVIDVLMGIGEAFHEEHRVRFNEFGINLRKNGHFDEAIRFYDKALEFNSRDENVLFNMARAYFDKGEKDRCKELLKRALEINPGFDVAKKFLKYSGG